MSKQLSEAFEEILPLKLSDEAAADVAGNFEGAPKQITAARAIAMALTAKAMRGDTKRMR